MWNEKTIVGSVVADCAVAAVVAAAAVRACIAQGLVSVSLLQSLLQVDRLMDMIVNSLYSNREVFLRELISNASDALDKVRFVGVTDAKALEGREQLEIMIKADKDANTITIE